ncbi:MAG: hypothetical protein DLM72_12755 [Candidatus Nitrosopolaris wilkensis]|nr:MAG: hypothetical protein DLM72_12755 [Candidatus Nitrosopolaris wilkensis]
MANTRRALKNRLSDHISTANPITTYIANVSIMSKSTAREYFARLNDFRGFITNEYHNRLSIDDLLVKVKKGPPGSIQSS